MIQKSQISEVQEKEFFFFFLKKIKLVSAEKTKARSLSTLKSFEICLNTKVYKANTITILIALKIIFSQISNVKLLNKNIKSL